MKTRKNAARGWAKGIAALGVLVLSSGLAVMAAAPSATAAPGDDDVNKSYVCKYKITPGGTELIQTGQNPIWVGNSSIAGNDVPVANGDRFADAQGFSVVVIANSPKLDPEPGIEICEPGVPDEEIVADVTFVDPTCENANEASYVVTGDTANFTVTDPAAAPGAPITVTATANEGFVFAGGSDTYSEDHTFGPALDLEGEPCVIVEPPVFEPPVVVPPVVVPPRVDPPVVDPPVVAPPAVDPPAVTPPSVVKAGLGSATPVASDAPGQQGLALVLAGMLLLICAGALGMVRPTGAGSRI